MTTETTTEATPAEAVPAGGAPAGGARPAGTAFTLPEPRLGAEDLRAVGERLAARAAGYDASGLFPAQSIAAVHEAGLLTATAGARFGGAGIGLEQTARILQALGEGDPAVALISLFTLSTHAREAQRPSWPEHLYARFLRESAQAPTLVNALRVEPELGSPARGGLPAAQARRTQAGWAVSGRKTFATGSTGLAYHLVWAVTDEPVQRVGTFVVPGDAAGIEVVPAWNHLGLRASVSHDVVYTDVEVPAADVIGLVSTENGGGRQDNLASAGWGLLVGAIYVGVARAAQRFFVRFAHERVPSALGRPIATTERIRLVAGEIEAQLVAAEEILYGLARQVDAGQPVGVRPFTAKLLITRAAIAAVEAAVAALGNPALTRANPLERHLRDVLCSRVHAPQDDTILLTTGTRSLAGPPAQLP